MRLLWEESGFELVGAFCVAAFTLGGAWTVMETIFGLSTVAAGLLAAVVAGWMLEVISRRHYADRLAPPSGRRASVGRPATSSWRAAGQPRSRTHETAGPRTPSTAGRTPAPAGPLTRSSRPARRGASTRRAA